MFATVNAKAGEYLTTRETGETTVSPIFLDTSTLNPGRGVEILPTTQA